MSLLKSVFNYNIINEKDFKKLLKKSFFLANMLRTKIYTFQIYILKNNFFCQIHLKKK